MLKQERSLWVSVEYKDCDGSPMRICQGQSYGKYLKFGGIGSGTSFHNNFLAFRKYGLKMKVIGE